MNAKKLKVEMTRDDLAEAIGMYFNRLLVGDYDVEKFQLHTGAKGGAAVSVVLTPEGSPPEVADE